MNNPPAGWYEDANDPSLLRWWDGNMWTYHTQANLPGKVHHPAKTGAAPRGKAALSNPAAVTGFSLGIAAFFLFSVPIFGLLISIGAGVNSGIGLSKQQAGMAKKYRVFAIIGLILGIIYTLMAVLALGSAR